MKSVGKSVLSDISWKFIYMLGRYVPSWLGTKRLTFLSLIASVSVFLSYLLSASKPVFFLAASAFIFLQWVLDCLDGHIGRKRNEGFVRWGYYMDHFFDYFFLGSIIFGFYVIFQANALIFLLFISSCYMLSVFLMYGATKDISKDIKVSMLGISPVEIRLAVILLNVFLFLRPDMLPFLLTEILPFFNMVLTILLSIVIYRNQKKLHALDMGKQDD